MMNSSINFTGDDTDPNTEFNHHDFIAYAKIINQATIIIWPIVAVIGILANGCVLLVILFVSKFKNSSTKSENAATKCFIFSLATSDLIFLTLCPFNALINSKFEVFDSKAYWLGLVICKLSYASSHVSFLLTVR